MAGADDAHKVVDAGNLDAVARQQHVVKRRLGSTHGLLQVDDDVGGILAQQLGVANVGIAGRSARAAHQVAQLLVARHNRIESRVLHLAADVDHLLELVLGDFAHDDLVVGLQGKV